MKGMVRRWAQAMAVSWIAGTGGCTSQKPAEPLPPQGPPPVAEPSLIVADSEAGLALGVSQQRFNFSSVRDLWARVRVQQLPRMSTMTLKLTAPGGETLYEDNAPVSTDPTVQMTPMAMTGMPAPVVTAKAFPGGGWSFDRAVPVAGSVLGRHPTPGMWQVSATSDGFSGAPSTAIEVVFER